MRKRATGEGPLKVVAGIIWNAGRYLAVQRPKGKRMAGWWEFPGGKVEHGESLDHALARELQEELSITVLDSILWREILHSYPDQHVHVYFYWVSAFQGRPKPREGQVVAWVVPGLNELPFLEADRQIVAELARLDPLNDS